MVNRIKKILVLLLCCPIYVLGQHTYKEPEVFDIRSEIFDVYFSVFNESYFPSFSPIGWSKDGCFAFREEFQGEMFGYDVVSVYSMITDENIENFYIAEFEDNADYTWGQKKYTINQLLHRYKIHDGKFGEFNTYPYISDFKIALEKKDSFFHLLLESKTPDTVLTIVEKEFDGEDIFFIGYFLSPFEDRVAILLIEAGSAEGEVRGWNLHIYGKKIPESNY